MCSTGSFKTCHGSSPKGGAMSLFWVRQTKAQEGEVRLHRRLWLLPVSEEGKSASEPRLRWLGLWVLYPFLLAVERGIWSSCTP